jgi:hypothetical protein
MEAGLPSVGRLFSPSQPNISAAVWSNIFTGRQFFKAFPVWVPQLVRQAENKTRNVKRANFIKLLFIMTIPFCKQ